MSAASDRSARLAIALPPIEARGLALAEEYGWDVRLFDAEDPDERALLIRLAHPELARAIDDDLDEVIVDGQQTSPRLHLAVHEIVAAQIIEADPPETYATAVRLLGLGRDPHEVLHMLGWTVSDQIWAVMHEGRAVDAKAQLRALDGLPESWDARASQVPINRAQRRAAARGRRRSPRR